MKNLTLFCFIFFLSNLSFSQQWYIVGTNFNISQAQDIVGNPDDSSLYVCGDRVVSRWDGNNWTYYDSLGYFTRCVEIFNNGVYAGGDFYQVQDGTIVKYIAKWDGNNWVPLGGGLWPGSSQAMDMEVYNNELYVCGNFNTAGGITSNNIAKWNGTAWNVGDGGTIPYLSSLGEVSQLLKYNGELYDLFWAGSPARSIICKYNGSTWSEVYNTFNNFGLATGSSLHLDRIAFLNGELHAIGIMSNASTGGSSEFIGKWNGTSWVQLPSGPTDGTPQDIYSLNNKLYVTGGITSTISPIISYVAEWNGVSWNNMDSGLDAIAWALGSLNGELYVGGNFSQAGSISAYHIAKWGEPATGLNNDINKPVSTIYPNPANEKFIIKTEFSDYRANIYNSIGQLLLTVGNSPKIVNTANFPSGIYFVEFVSDSNIILSHQRIIISK
jgi:hypothetical protein